MSDGDPPRPYFAQFRSVPAGRILTQSCQCLLSCVRAPQSRAAAVRVEARWERAQERDARGRWRRGALSCHLRRRVPWRNCESAVRADAGSGEVLLGAALSGGPDLHAADAGAPGGVARHRVVGNSSGIPLGAGHSRLRSAAASARRRGRSLVSSLHGHSWIRQACRVPVAHRSEMTHEQTRPTSRIG